MLSNDLKLRMIAAGLVSSIGFGAAGYGAVAAAEELGAIAGSAVKTGYPAVEAVPAAQGLPPHNNLADGLPPSVVPAPGHFVTVAQFESFIASTGHVLTSSCRAAGEDRRKRRVSLSFRDPGFEISADDPAVCIGWRDASAYAVWLAEATGTAYRLPSPLELRPEPARGAMADGPRLAFWTSACVRSATGAARKDTRAPKAEAACKRSAEFSAVVKQGKQPAPVPETEARPFIGLRLMASGG